MTRVAFAEIQCVIHRPYPLAHSRYLLFNFPGTGRGDVFLRELLPMVTMADAGTLSDGVNIGVTFEGLRALGVSEDVLAEFPEDFKESPAANVMGDFAESAPRFWWAGKFSTAAIHLLVQLTASQRSGLEALTAKLRSMAGAAAITELVPSNDGTVIEGQHLGDRRLHFGYRDGLSQPDIAWDDAEPMTNKVNFRHFILGYSNSQISSGPKEVRSRSASTRAVSLAQNGTYAVFRWLYQDVATFNRFLATEGPRASPHLDQAAAEETLAAKLVGRWRDGTPLPLSPSGPVAALNDVAAFSYSDSDPNGLACPFAAHVRVVNPRDQPLDAAEFGFVPRVIRRGTPFGPVLTGTRDDGQLRGLVGVFLCASISAQFYKLMSWMKRTDFSPVFTNLAGQDPFASRRIPGASGAFEVNSGERTSSIALPELTRTLGTAFFLLPGRLGLRQLAGEA
jgi:deferrochelatase/peroxidase EfeB